MWKASVKVAASSDTYEIESSRLFNHRV